MKVAPWLAEANKKLEMMPQQAKELRELALADLNTFATLVNPGYMYGDIHKKIFKWLESYELYVEDADTQNKLIMLPRAHLKSHCVATWVAWIITRHPEVTILYLSATSGLAETQLFAIQNILLSPTYTRYFPEYINPNETHREKWTGQKISIDHPKRRAEGIRDFTLATAGLTTNTTGWHADIIVADDLVVPENAYTEDGRDSVVKKSSQFTSIRNAGGFTLACGTRYHPSDIYATWKAQMFDVYDEDGLESGRKPVWDTQEYPVEEDGVFIWPRVMRPSDKKFFGFDQRVLARIRAEYEDSTQFYAQYYNNPNDPGSNRISRDCFQYYDVRHLKQVGGNWYFKHNRLNVYASMDFAYTLKKKNDYSAIVVVGIDCDGFIYVLDIERFKTDVISGYFDKVKELHSKWEFTKMRGEVTAAQSLIVRDLKDLLREEGLRLTIEEYRPTRHEGTKFERIASVLEHRYENRVIWHARGGYTDVMEEELVLARPPHDDIKDALASAISIAIKPARSRSNGSERHSGKLPYHSRFGGVAFRGN